MSVNPRVLAQVIKDAKDAPTSFEDEDWLEGFEDARQMIAHRLKTELGLPDPFLDECDVPA